MIRPFTFLCFCAFAGAGAWLYQVKHSVALQDRELAEIRRQTEQARERIAILRAEWALLNEPARLRQVAQQHLALEPMQPQQFVRISEAERRLPVAVAFAGPPNLFAPPPALEPAHAPRGGVMLATAQVPAPATRGGARAAANAAPPAAADHANDRAASADPRAPEAPSPQALAAALAAQRAEQEARRAEQEARRAAQPAVAPQRPRVAPPAPAATPAPSPAPRPVQPAVHVTPRPSAPSEPVTRMTRATPPPTTVASALGGASALGLGRPMLAPPVPVAPAAAATLDGHR